MRWCRDAGAAGIAGRAAGLALAIVTLPALLVAAARPHFPVAPPPATTGGFGEPTCQQCHDGNALDDPAGTLALHGIPERGWEPGRTYRVTIAVRRPGMRRGGFEVAARWAAGADSGRQAGRWSAPDPRTATTTQHDVVYVHHTDAGAEPSADSASWTADWTAPAATGPVVFHVAALAADGGGSSFDDYVYARGFLRAGRR